jgi:hypothetical protein
LRYYKEKSRGGQKRLAVRWLTPAQAELAKSAIAEGRKLTGPARKRARILEQRPDTVLLPTMLDSLTLNQVAELLGCRRSSLSAISSSKLPRQLSAPTGSHYVYRASDVMSYLFSFRGPLWVVDRRDGTKQLLSESLFIQFHNAGHAVKGMNPSLWRTFGNRH